MNKSGRVQVGKMKMIHGLLPAKNTSLIALISMPTMCGQEGKSATNYTPNVTCGNCKRTKKFAEYEEVWKNNV